MPASGIDAVIENASLLPGWVWRNLALMRELDLRAEELDSQITQVLQSTALQDVSEERVQMLLRRRRVLLVEKLQLIQQTESLIGPYYSEGLASQREAEEEARKAAAAAERREKSSKKKDTTTKVTASRSNVSSTTSKTAANSNAGRRQSQRQSAKGSTGQRQQQQQKRSSGSAVSGGSRTTASSSSATLPDADMSSDGLQLEPRLQDFLRPNRDSSVSGSTTAMTTATSTSSVSTPRHSGAVEDWNGLCPECGGGENAFDGAEYMVACDICNNWYHFVCVGYSENAASEQDDWFCPTCVRSEPGRVTRQSATRQSRHS